MVRPLKNYLNRAILVRSILAQVKGLQLLAVLSLISSPGFAHSGGASLAPHTSRLGLILIQTKNALPHVDPSVSNHAETVLWPPFLGTRGSNRLLSLMSGVDWIGDDYDLSFRAANGHGFESNNFDSLLTRGYLAQRTRWLEGMQVSAIARPIGVASVNFDLLLLALGSDTPVETPVPFDGPWPDSGLLVFEAENWDEAQKVTDRMEGRVLILELVPLGEGAGKGSRTWGSFYLRGRGWPQGLPVDASTGVAGLVRARNAVKLLMHPESMSWSPSTDAADPVGSWFIHVRSYGSFLMAAALLTLIFVLGAAAYCVSIERRGPLAAGLLLAVLAAPPTLLLQGALEQRYGIANWPVLLVGCSLAVALLVSACQWVATRCFPGAHPLLAVSLVGLIVCTSTEPKWSVFSGLFGFPTLTVPAEGLGLLVGYLTAVVAFARLSSVAGRWLGRVCVVGVVAAGFLGNRWWYAETPQLLALPVLSLLAGEGWMNAPLLLIFMLIPNPHSDPFRHGFAWAPLGCLNRYSEVDALNAGSYLAFLLYPGLWGIFFIVLGVASFGDRFLLNQFRRLLRADPRLKALPWAAAGLGAMGILNPLLLPGALFVAYGGAIAFFYTAVWTL